MDDIVFDFSPLTDEERKEITELVAGALLLIDTAGEKYATRLGTVEEVNKFIEEGGGDNEPPRVQIASLLITASTLLGRVEIVMEKMPK